MLVHTHIFKVFLLAKWVESTKSIQLQISFFELTVEIEDSFEDSVSLHHNNLGGCLVLRNHLAIKVVNSEDDLLLFFVCCLELLEKLFHIIKDLLFNEDLLG